MNKTTAALKLAEEALGVLKNAINDEDGWVSKAEKTIKNLEDLIADEWYEKLLWGKREALAEQEKQEPVAWMWQSVDIESRSIETGLLFNRGTDDENTDWIPLYAAPVSAPKQEPVAYKYKESSPETGEFVFAAPVDAKTIRAEALEEAAKVCDGYAENSSNPMNFAENCAAAIRARVVA